MKNKIKADYLFGMPKVYFEGEYAENLALLACMMESMTKVLMLNTGCSYEQAKDFIQDLPNKFTFEKHGLTLIQK